MVILPSVGFQRILRLASSLMARLNDGYVG